MCGYNANKHNRYHDTALVAQLVVDLKVFYVLQYLGGRCTRGATDNNGTDFDLGWRLQLLLLHVSYSTPED